MHGLHGARAHEEGAEQAEREAHEREEDGEAPELPSPSRLDERVHERGGRQPRNEGRVLNGIPEPPAAPAELVVGPPGSEHVARRQEAPGDDRKTRREVDGRLRPAARKQQRAHGREHQRQARIAHEEHGRMQDHADVLQDGIEVTTVGRHHRQVAQERIRREEQERAEAREHRKHQPLKPRREEPVGAPDEARPGRADRHEPDPEEHRAFVRAPEGRGLVGGRELGVGVICDVGDGEIVGQEGPDERGRRKREHERRQKRRRAAEARIEVVAPSNAVEDHGGCKERRHGGDDEQEVAEFGDHFGCPDGWSGRMYADWNLTRKPALRLKTASGPRACETPVVPAVQTAAARPAIPVRDPDDLLRSL